MEPSAFGKRIRDARIENNLSLRDLGKLANISAVHVRRIENGQCQIPSLKIIVNLSKALDIPLEELIEAAISQL